MLIEALDYDLLRERNTFEEAVNDLAEVAGFDTPSLSQIGSDFKRGAKVVGGAIKDQWLANWREGYGRLTQILRLGIPGQEGLEQALMSKLPALERQANLISEKVTVWQQEVDELLKEFGAHVSGTGYDPIEPSELPSSWRSKLRKLARGGRLSVPVQTIADLQNLTDDVLSVLEKQLAKSPEAKKMMTEYGFNGAAQMVRDSMDAALNQIEDAAGDLEKFSGMVPPKDDANIDRYLAMANDVIESIDAVMGPAEEAALGIVQLLDMAVQRVPQAAQRQTIALGKPRMLGGRGILHRPHQGQALRQTYQQAGGRSSLGLPDEG